MSTLKMRPVQGFPGGSASVRILSAIFLLSLAVCLTACNHTLQSLNSNPPAQDSGPTIVVTPNSASVSPGGTVQFTAMMRNTRNTAVRWSASAGAISETGLFSAPAAQSPAAVTVVATSAFGISSAAAVVNIAPSEKLSILSKSLPPALTGVPYTATLAGGGGVPPYQWSSSSGTLPAGFQLDTSSGVVSGSANLTGTFPWTVSVKDAQGTQAVQSLTLTVSTNQNGNFDGPAELPRVYLQTSLAYTPAPGRAIHVNADGDFQAALDGAACGDTILLQAGATFSGVFDFPQKSCDDEHWIIVRTSAPDASLPPEGTRLTPCYAGVASLPGRPAFHCSSTHNVMAKLIFVNKTGYGPVVLDSGANHYRLMGLEITRAEGTELVSNLITPTTHMPADHIILDRVWVHGTTHDETTRGIYLAAVASAAVVDSYFSDFHCVAKSGSCTDAQAIGGGGGDYPAGPYKIVNNFLEAAGENILFGGGAATTTPADIEIRRNHLFKPLHWMPGQPGFVGGSDGNPFIVKNNFELKNAQRVLFEGNIAEYSWGGFTQFGYSLAISPKNQASGDENVCPTCLVTDITIRYSTISHAAAGINIANALSDNGGAAAAGTRYSIHDITLDDLDNAFYQGAGPLILLLNGWSTNVLSDVSITHITGFGDPLHPVLTIGNDTSHPQMSKFVFSNNLVVAGKYPVWSSGGGKTNCAFYGIPITTINACFNPYMFRDNAIIGSPANYPPSKWPAGNYFPVDAAAVQFVNYKNANGGNYQLLPSSPYKNAASDGKDIGADIDSIRAATAGVY